ncbi:hypothetical protein LNP25_01240 [Klebsiella variicola subsp. variicola]|nr:hypothetical protein [Klebsiella variicola subsp. variicola]
MTGGSGDIILSPFANYPLPNGSGSCRICLALICLHKLSTIAIAEKTIKANR